MWHDAGSTSLYDGLSFYGVAFHSKGKLAQHQNAMLSVPLLASPKGGKNSGRNKARYWLSGKAHCLFSRVSLLAVLRGSKLCKSRADPSVRELLSAAINLER